MKLLKLTGLLMLATSTLLHTHFSHAVDCSDIESVCAQRDQAKQVFRDFIKQAADGVVSPDQFWRFASVYEPEHINAEHEQAYGPLRAHRILSQLQAEGGGAGFSNYLTEGQVQLRRFSDVNSARGRLVIADNQQQADQAQQLYLDRLALQAAQEYVSEGTLWFEFVEAEDYQADFYPRILEHVLLLTDIENDIYCAYEASDGETYIESVSLGFGGYISGDFSDICNNSPYQAMILLSRIVPEF